MYPREQKHEAPLLKMLQRQTRLGWIAALATAVATLPAMGSADPAQYTPLEVQGEVEQNGIFDPTVEYPRAGGTGWLAYSWVGGELPPWGPIVETHLASSSDGGETWSFVQVVNPSLPETISLVGGGTATGLWNHEVPSLVHDPDDPGREWKLFSHRIFREVDGGVQQYLPSYSWIAMRTASDPAGVWSAEEHVFGGTFSPPAGFAIQPAENLNGLDPSLLTVVAYSEPGTLHRDGSLYVSLTALQPDGPDRIVLLVSHDHGASWDLAGIPVTRTDMAALGYLSLDGTALAEQDGRAFLLGTPATSEIAHLGTLVFEFDELATGALERHGTLQVHKHLLPIPGFVSERGAGQADFHEQNTAGGLLMPQINLPEFPHFFQVFDTHADLVSSTLAVPLLGPVWSGLAAAALAGALRAAFRRRR